MYSDIFNLSINITCGHAYNFCTSKILSIYDLNKEGMLIVCESDSLPKSIWMLKNSFENT